MNNKLTAIIREQQAPAIRKLLRNVPDIFDYGGVEGTDCTAAINNATANLWATDGLADLYFPAGTYYIDSQTNDIEYGLNLFGDHMSVTILRIRHAGDGLKFTGIYPVGGGSGPGGSLKNLSLSYDVGAGNNAGTALTLLDSANPNTHGPDFFIADGINITSFTGTLTRGVLLDGSARFGVGVLIGIRAITMNNVIIFNTTTNAVEVRLARALSMNRFQCYVGAGTTNDVLITASNSTYKTDSVILSNFTGGNVNLDYVNQFRGSGFGNMTTTANTTNASWT